MKPTLISCATHDYIEIACTFGYHVKLELFSGSTLQGKAKTTETTPHKKEYLIIENAGEIQKIELVTIKKMTATQPNSYFDSITFS